MSCALIVSCAIHTHSIRVQYSFHAYTSNILSLLLDNASLRFTIMVNEASSSSEINAPVSIYMYYLCHVREVSCRNKS